jgi:hypothetical protein
MWNQEFGGLKKCMHCDNYHSGVCSKIKSIEYYPDGTIKKVEYHQDLWCQPSVSLKHEVDESKVF